MATGITTYTYGPKITFGESISRGQFMLLCDQIGEAFGTRAVPEGIAEGGILFPDVVGYKSMRLQCRPWPWVTDGGETWRGDASILVPADATCHRRPRTMFLKAFDNAPRWTPDEVEQIMLIFSEHGIQSKITRKRLVAI